MAAPRQKAKLSVDDDDYWSSSAASKSIQRGHNLFDDDTDFKSAKDFLRKQLQTEDLEYDYDDCINLDSSKVDVSASSARYRAGGQTSESSLSSGSSSSSSSHMAAAKGDRQRPTFQSGPSFTASHPELSIDDVVSKHTPKAKAPTVTDVAKLEAEINFLKRSLHSAKNQRFTAPAPDETIKRIIMGQTYSLELYRSKEQKLELLDAALKTHDGNAITAAVLFLRDTIKANIFNLELMRRPQAVEHYINFLRKHFEIDKLIDWLSMLGRTDEAAMIKYKQAVSTKNVDTKIRMLQACSRSHFQSDSWLQLESSLLQEQIAMLERQRPVEEEDLREVTKGNPKFREHPRECILDVPVMKMLDYCCFYHYDLGENYYGSPQGIRKAHGLTDKQYTWACILARARLQKWQDLEPLFQTKGFFGGTKVKAVVAFDRVVHALSQHNAPRSVMNVYCDHIDDVDLRLEVAQKHKLHESILKTYFNQKDRQGIQDYQAQLKINSPEWFLACDLLRNSSVKWKN